MESADRPSVTVDQTFLDPLQLEASQKITHGDRRLGGVPVHIRTGTGRCEADSLDQHP